MQQLAVLAILCVSVYAVTTDLPFCVSAVPDPCPNANVSCPETLLTGCTVTGCRPTLAAPPSASCLSSLCTNLCCDLTQSTKVLGLLAKEPSFVYIAISLVDCLGTPIPNAPSSEFLLLEDGGFPDPLESRLQAIPTPATYALATLLVLDTSGSIWGNASAKADLIQALRAFVAKYPTSQALSIKAFTGRATLYGILDFTVDPKTINDAVDYFATKFTPDDIQTNLNGAVVSASAIVQPLKQKYGELAIVFFSDGRDDTQTVSSTSALNDGVTRGRRMPLIGLRQCIIADTEAVCTADAMRCSSLSPVCVRSNMAGAAQNQMFTRN